MGILLLPVKLPYPSWRSTLVTAVSIPLSVLMAMALMRWLPGAVHGALSGSADSSQLVTFLLRLFPSSITLNIMTLSGLTVAIGRVVDDSIVVLENIFRQVQAGGDKKTAIITGTRDVSVAIFAATVITVVVFLPLGLTGGIIGEFFLPFGLAVTYALLSSFVVAITVVPVLAYLLLDEREISGEHESWLERLYRPALHWSLDKPSHRVIVLIAAVVTFVFGMVLFATRPQAFLPSFGEPQISVSINLPSGTKIADTNALVEQFEAVLKSDLPQDELGAVQTTIGSGGGLESLILGNSSISENVAQVAIAVESQSKLDELAGIIRGKAGEVFGVDNVQVSAASLSEQGFGGFRAGSIRSASRTGSDQRGCDRYAQRRRRFDQRHQQSLGNRRCRERRSSASDLHPHRWTVRRKLHRRTRNREYARRDQRGENGGQRHAESAFRHHDQ